jgi:hypothetical protein
LPISITILLWQVDAEVIQDGRVLSGLGKHDFRVLDENKPQPLLHLSAGDTALDLILLFDISGSMGRVVAAVSAAAQQGLDELRPPATASASWCSRAKAARSPASRMISAPFRKPFKTKC